MVLRGTVVAVMGSGRRIGDTWVLGVGVCLAGCRVGLSFEVGLIWVLANLFLGEVIYDLKFKDKNGLSSAMSLEMDLIQTRYDY